MSWATSPGLAADSETTRPMPGLSASIWPAISALSTSPPPPNQVKSIFTPYLPVQSRDTQTNGAMSG